MADGEDVRFVKLDPERVNELKEISLETFTQSFFHLNTRENFDAYVSSAFNEEILKQELSAPVPSFILFIPKSSLGMKILPFG